MKKIILILTFIVIWCTALVAQSVTVKGKVSDISGNVLPGVSVVVKGTTTGTVTDSDGKFTMSVPANAKTLMFSFVGMKTLEFQIGTQTIFNVTLTEDVMGINEVIVVGYGTQKKSDITGTVA